MAPEDERQPLAGVGKTALGMALVRTEETKRPDRLFADPYAEAFVAAIPDPFGEEEAISPEQAQVGIVFFFHATIRTRFFDDFLVDATREGCKQVVLLAAGLDTRAFRMEWPPDTHLFELDLPEVLAFKEQVMTKEQASPRCSERRVVTGDLRHGWSEALRGAGFEPRARTAWLVEGVMTYLGPEEAEHLLEVIGELSADESRLAFEEGVGADDSLLAEARSIADMQEFTSLWKGGLAQDASRWLEGRGWTTAPHDVASLASDYGRPLPTGAGGRLVTARRQGRHKPPSSG